MQYTEQVNLALKYAKQTAKQCGQSYIGSEHLLMGLLREESGMASAILKECKVDAEKLYGLIQELIVPEGMLADKVLTGYSLRAQEILEQGEEWALLISATGAHVILMTGRKALNTRSSDLSFLFLKIYGRKYDER